MKKILLNLMLIPLFAFTQTLDQDLLLHLKFDGNADDDSGYNRHGTIFGMPTFISGVDGEAIYLDGVDDYVQLIETDDLVLESFTLSAWVNWQGAPDVEGSWAILSNWYGGSYFQHYGLRMGTIAPGIPFNHAVIFYDDGTEWDWVYGYKEEISNEGWHFIVGVVEAGEFAEVYLDGYDVGRDETSIPNSINPSGDLCVGKDGESSMLGPVQFWNGYIDEVKIYNRALTHDEIEDIYETIPLGVKTRHLDQKVNIYPNPASDNIRIESNNFIGLLKIFDLTGNLVAEFDATHLRQKQFDISHLISGIYFVEANGIKKKIVKQD